MKSRPVRLPVIALCLLLSVAPASCAAEPLQKHDLRPPRLAGLQFEDAATERRLKALESGVRQLADASWRSIPWQRCGNFFMARWCHGTGARADGQIASSTQHDRDQHVIELHTLFYGKKFPQVFGMGVAALWIPPGEGWGAYVAFDEGGKSVVGEGFSLSFHRYDTPTGEPDTTLTLGEQYEYSVFDTEYALAVSDLPVCEGFALLTASPEALRDRGLAQLADALKEMEEIIRSGKASRREYGEYLGRGVPPVALTRPLTPAEQKEALAKARSHFTGQKQLLRTHYREMYAALLKAFPLDRCWRGEGR